MSGIKIKPEQLSATLKKELDEYHVSVVDKVKSSVKKVATEAVKELKSTSPKKTGKYARSWTQKQTRGDANGIGITVYAHRYQLTHLLENGHAKRGGGRVAARVHIRPVEEKATKELEEEIRKEASDG